MAKDNKEIRVTIRLSDREAKKLDRLCADKHMTISETVRFLINKTE